MKIERIDFYKSALWNKIVVLCVVKMRVKLEVFICCLSERLMRALFTDFGSFTEF